MCARVHLSVCAYVCVCAQRGTVTDGGHAVPRAGSQARCMLGCVHRRQEKHRQKLRLSLCRTSERFLFVQTRFRSVGECWSIKSHGISQG